MYIKVTNGVPEKYSVAQLRKDTGIMIRDNPTTETLLAYGMYDIPEPRMVPTDTQVQLPPEFVKVGAGDGDWEYQHNVRDMTAQELADKSRSDDVRYIRDGVELIGKLQVQLIDKLLADLVITPDDFSLNVRQDYQALKAAVDRIAD